MNKLNLLFAVYSINLFAIQRPPELSFLNHKKDYRVALKATNGNYVAAETGGGTYLIANRPHLGPWETFILRCLTDGCTQVALQVHGGQWVSVNQISTNQNRRGRGISNLMFSTPVWRVLANRSEVGPWETFTLHRDADGQGNAALQTHKGTYIGLDTGGLLKADFHSINHETLFQIIPVPEDNSDL